MHHFVRHKNKLRHYTYCVCYGSFVKFVLSQLSYVYIFALYHLTHFPWLTHYLSG